MTNAEAVNPVRIGRRLQQLRVERGLSRTRLAAIVRAQSATAFARQHLWRIEAGGTRASLDTLERVCTALDVRLADVFQEAP